MLGNRIQDRLRGHGSAKPSYGTGTSEFCLQRECLRGADRINELEVENADLRAKLERAKEALRELFDFTFVGRNIGLASFPKAGRETRDRARAALATLEGKP